MPAASKLPSLEQLKSLFDEAASQSDAAGASPRPAQHDGLQPPSAPGSPPPGLTSHPSLQLQHAGSLQQQHSLGLLDRTALQQQHSLGLLDRKALSQRTRLQVGLPARGGSKCSSTGELADWLAGGTATPPLQPLPDYSSKVSALLARRCGKCRAMLDRLQQPVFCGVEAGLAPPLPSMALRVCKGLAFVKQRKAGLIGGWTWGDALLIQRLPDGSWSPPCFLTLRFASLGLTLGVHRMLSVHVLQSAEQVAALARDSSAVSWDVTLSGEYNPLLDGDSNAIKHRDFSPAPLASEAGAQPHQAQAVDGIMWDVSLRVGLTLVNDSLHAQLYGPGTTPADILGGKLAVPPEMEPLYRDIEQRAAEAKITRRTTSKFEEARLKKQLSTNRMRRVSSPSASFNQKSLQRQSYASAGDAATAATSTVASGAGGNSLGRGSPYSAGMAPATPAGGSPTCEDGPCNSLGSGLGLGGLGGSLKLFDDVPDIGFVETHTYEQQDAEEEQAEEEQQQAAEQQAAEWQRHAQPAAAAVATAP